jgi:transglutaminase-like putative cysteine protease
MPEDQQSRNRLGGDRSSATDKGEVTLTAAIRRYFDVGLYLMIFTGFGTLASTGRLDLPTVVLVTGALLYRGYALSRRWRKALLSERWTNLLTIGCVAYFIADEFLISRTFLGATVHLVLFVMLVRLFSAQRDRDHYLLAVLSFLMVLSAAVLTVDSTFLIALAGFVLVAVATFILMEMAHSSQKSPVQARDLQVPRAYRKLSFAIVCIAPVLLALIFIGAALIFFLLPRVSAGYLSAYTAANDLSTGFSDRVELGRIGQIQQSKSVVMHVQVDGDTTGAMQLKLRGVTLDSFDGKSWTNTRNRLVVKRGPDGRFNLRWRNSLPLGRDIHYRVTMEPFLSEVFFLLATPASLQGNYRVLSEDSAGDIFNLDTEHSVGAYEADSTVRVSGLPELRRGSVNFAPEVSPGYLQLPVIDPRVFTLAEQITAKSGSQLAKAQAIEAYLRLHYGYTLQLPETEPADPIGNFLFVRRQGHCEYFASAMAVMLRTLRIPSRVVNGFSGGEFNDVNSRYVIRASDAHSWVEAYIHGEGWKEFDPTPPGSAQVQTSWGRFMLYMDAMASFWREWVVNYDLAHQFRLSQDANRGSRVMVGRAQNWGRTQYNRMLAWARRIQDKVGDSSEKWEIWALILFVGGLLIAAVPRLIALLGRLKVARRPRKSPQLAATIWYERMLRQAARRGWNKSPMQTPEEFVSTIGEPQLKGKVLTFTEHYERARFGKSPEEASRLPELYEEIKASGKRD